MFKLLLPHANGTNNNIFLTCRFLKTDYTLINQLDYDSRSALHIAASRGHTDLVERFIKEGANIKAKDV